MNARALWHGLNNPKYRYVAVTILVSLLAFARNLFFMKSLDLASLGQVTLMTTLIMLVGYVQVGMINGAYNQYAARDREVNRRIVELMTTGVLALIPLAIIVTMALQTTGVLAHLVWPETLAFGIAAGIATLASTWMNNALIADGLLGRSNLINVAAVLTSLLAAFLSLDYGLSAALSSLMLQPLIVVLAALVLDPNLRPRSLGLHRETLRLLFRLGSMPFFAGLAVLLMYQVERWSIAAILGSEALGKFYIVLMYTTFFALIPAALMNVYLPPAKRAYVARETRLLMDNVRHHQRDLLAYFLLAVLVTVLLMPPAVERFLPKFTDSAALVYYALPGLVLFTLRNTASLVLYSSGQMRPLLVAGVVTLSLFCVGLTVLWVVGHFSLASVLVARMLATLPGTVLLVVAQRRQLNDMGPARCAHS